MVASALGNVCYSNKPLVFYRQHGNNSIGFEKNFVKKTILRFRRVLSSEKNITSKQLLNFYNVYKSDLPKIYSNEVRAYFKSNKSFIKRIKYVMYTKVYRQTYFETFVFKTLYVFGKYRI